MPFSPTGTNPFASTGKEGLHRMNEMGDKESDFLFDKKGLVAILGRGESAPAITYIALYNTNGTLCYCFPNAAGNDITVQTSKP